MKYINKKWLSGAVAATALFAIIGIANGYTNNENAISTKNKETIMENYLIQDSEDHFVRELTAPNNCSGTASLNCKYSITEEGKDNIPATQSSYDADEVQDFLDLNYLEPVTGSGPGLYQ